MKDVVPFKTGFNCDNYRVNLPKNAGSHLRSAAGHLGDLIEFHWEKKPVFDMSETPQGYKFELVSGDVKSYRLQYTGKLDAEPGRIRLETVPPYTILTKNSSEE